MRMKNENHVGGITGSKGRGEWHEKQRDQEETAWGWANAPQTGLAEDEMGINGPVRGLSTGAKRNREAQLKGLGGRCTREKNWEIPGRRFGL